MGKSRVEPLAAAASREKRFKNHTSTQNAFCQSHSLDAHFCRGGVLYLGELTQGFRQHFQQSQGGRSTRGLGASAGPLQASGRAPKRSSASTPPTTTQHKRLPRAHLISPRPRSRSTSPQTPLCDRFLDSPTDPPPPSGASSRNPPPP